MPTPANFGTDLSCTDDLDASGRLVSGFELLAEALHRRLITPHGGLFYSAAYGFDLRAELNDAVGPRDIPRIRAGVLDQVLQDERVDSAHVDANFDPRDPRRRTLLVTITGQTSAGPFRFVFTATPTLVQLEAT